MLERRWLPDRRRGERRRPATDPVSRVYASMHGERRNGLDRRSGEDRRAPRPETAKRRRR
jgi:hypothetical protein